MSARSSSRSRTVCKEAGGLCSRPAILVDDRNPGRSGRSRFVDRVAAHVPDQAPDHTRREYQAPEASQCLDHVVTPNQEPSRYRSVRVPIAARDHVTVERLHCRWTWRSSRKSSAGTSTSEHRHVRAHRWGSGGTVRWPTRARLATSHLGGARRHGGISRTRGSQLDGLGNFAEGLALPYGPGGWTVRHRGSAGLAGVSLAAWRIAPPRT